MKFLILFLLGGLLSFVSLKAQQSLIADSALVNRISDSLIRTSSAKYSGHHDSVVRKVKDSLKWDMAKKIGQSARLKTVNGLWRYRL